MNKGFSGCDHGILFDMWTSREISDLGTALNSGSPAKRVYDGAVFEIKQGIAH